MKTFLFLFIIALSANTLTAQKTYVPDDRFEQVLIDLRYDWPPLDNYVLSKNIATVTSLNLKSKGISDLTGIEDFIALKVLNCSYNHLTNINLDDNVNLQSLDCTYNNLIDLNLSNCIPLEWLLCSNNKLTSLNLANNTELFHLNCIDNKITNLILGFKPKLKEIWAYNNQIIDLDISGCSQLLELRCFNNQLSILDVSNNQKLKFIDCSYNQLTILNLNNNPDLEGIWCRFNQLSEILICNKPVVLSLYSNNNKLNKIDLRGLMHSSGLNLLNNPNLFCIQVSDSLKAVRNSSWHKDPHAVYSEDCSLVSVEVEKEAGQAISISPNPAEDYIDVNLNNAIPSEEKYPSFQIYNILGIMTVSRSFAHYRTSDQEWENYKIDVSALPKGVYFLKIGEHIKKFVKI